MLIITII